MGRVIREFRLHPSHGHRPVSQSQVAAMVGITQAQVSRIENGPPIVHLDLLNRWARELRIPQRCLWFALPAPPGDDRQARRELDHLHTRPPETPEFETFEIADLWPPIPLSPTSEKEDEDMRRRDLLRALGAMGVAEAMFDPAETIRRNVEQGLTEPLSDRDVHDWEITAAGYGRDLGAVTPERLRGQLLRDLAEVGGLMQVDLPQRSRSRMQRVAAQLASATAVTVIAIGRPQDAQRWWRTARRCAEQAGDVELETFILGQQALLSLYGGHSARTTLDLADRARAVGADRACAGTASAHATRAQALAVLGHRDEAAASLESLLRLFERLPDHVTGDATSWYSYSEHNLRHTESYVWTWLGRSTQAQNAQQRALAAIPEGKYRGRAQINLHHATCLIRDGDPTSGIAEAISVMEGLPVEARGDRFVHRIASGALAGVPTASHRTDAVRHYRALLALPAGPTPSAV
jgi:transcriptional regulator with XRE-family HTH domain